MSNAADVTIIGREHTVVRREGAQAVQWTLSRFASGAYVLTITDRDLQFTQHLDQAGVEAICALFAEFTGIHSSSEETSP